MGQMMQTKEAAITGGVLSCRIMEEGVEVTGCLVKEGSVVIPQQLEGRPVISVGRKAFLSSRELREVILPDSLLRIDEWAFAHCRSLETVVLPRRWLALGRGIFKDCKSLRHIYLDRRTVPAPGQVSAEEEKLSGLLAAVPVMLEAEYLLQPLEAGEEQWLRKLDARLLTLLQTPDREGYLKQVLCGEEDLMASLEVYLKERRQQKAALCYMRLANDLGLPEKERNDLEQFLRENTRGCEYEAAWELLLKEYGRDGRLLDIFLTAGCVNTGNLDAMLISLGETQPELKAGLLRSQTGEKAQPADFFDQFAL